MFLDFTIDAIDYAMVVFKGMSHPTNIPVAGTGIAASFRITNENELFIYVATNRHFIVTWVRFPDKGPITEREIKQGIEITRELVGKLK